MKLNNMHLEFASRDGDEDGDGDRVGAVAAAGAPEPGPGHDMCGMCHTHALHANAACHINRIRNCIEFAMAMEKVEQDTLGGSARAQKNNKLRLPIKCILKVLN